MPLAFVFPGQGSQYPGMLGEYDGHPQVAAALGEVSDAVGADLASLCAAGGDAEKLNDTSNTQPALLGMSAGVFRAWFAEGGMRPAIMAGHSLGEYSALVCGGALELRDAAALVRARAEVMKSAVAGAGKFAMCAVIGVGPDVVIEVCARHEGVHAVNFNSPVQTVVAGPADAVAAAKESLCAAGAKKTVPLAVSVPSHCEWMAPAAEAFRASLADAQIRMPEIPVLHNATLAAAETPEQIRDALAQQLVRPVNWVETVVALYRQADTFVECGPGQVLTGLNRRIAKGADSAAMPNSPRIAEQANA